MKKLRLVIDTNILLISMGRKSKYNWLFDSFVKEKFKLLVTTPILLEYYEKITERTTQNVAENVLRIISENPATINVEVYYRWHIITQDPDDDAFVDCAFSGNADYLITNDSDFNVLKDRKFPKINVISLEDFQTLYLNGNLW